MDPFEMAWQLLKEVGIEGPADPHRPGMSPGINPATGLPHEAHEEHVNEQLNQALEEEARLRNMPTDQSELPPPPSPEDTMRQMPPRTGDLRGFPPHMIEAIERAVANSPGMREKYEAQRSARGERPPQGTSAQNPDDVLRSMSPIDLAMDALQKGTPRSYRGEPGYKQFAEHAMTEGADTPPQMSQDDWQENLDIMADGNEHEDDINTPSEIPVEDPARHHQLDVGRQEAMRRGINVPVSDDPTPMERFELERRRRDEGRLQSPATNPFKMGPSL